ncbi:hypothetical protein PQC07_gp180 [Aeromonas phage D3]|uniref:Uncharacterized protein n=1 Tax=Aeromonas phage D3 TaxID=2593327 RepID=A0A514TVS0_9CAUD|nr:hypothetical protein PQC07_gp180 [Aeromonas phage D3]QDJ97093.1 hypothetical protein D3_0095 [Aeromonas phage D3]
MIVTFTELVEQNLPEGHSLSRIYSVSKTHSVLETHQDGIPHEYMMEKLDISELFIMPPVIGLPHAISRDSLYNLMSERFDLGLVKGIDYLDGTMQQVTDDPMYVTLPIHEDSHGYTGELRFYVVNEKRSLSGNLKRRDLTGCDHTIVLNDFKLRTLLVSKTWGYGSEKRMFSFETLSGYFVSLLMTAIKETFGEEQDVVEEGQFTRGVVTGLLNDGLSDIAIFKLYNGVEYLIRFSSPKGDLPLHLKETEDANLLDENSKEILAGSVERIGKSEGEETITTEEEEIAIAIDDDFLIPSLPPKENTPS